uniref:Motile sperm domain containing 3 n=1 Tax=Sus scrofa TaxID=9823 RepID=A0A8D0P298_PIG
PEGELHSKSGHSEAEVRISVGLSSGRGRRHKYRSRENRRRKGQPRKRRLRQVESGGADWASAQGRPEGAGHAAEWGGAYGDQEPGLKTRARAGSWEGQGLRVLCTAPAKYTVFDAEGYVKPQSCIDIVIRHVAPNPSHYDVQDRFRIELSEEGTEGRVVGRKDITSVLRAPTYPPELQGQPDPTPHPGPPSWTAPPSAQHFPENPHPQLATSSFLLFLLMGIVSVAFLLLPLQDELGSQLPPILHVSLGQKLVAAYVLGEHSGGGRGCGPRDGEPGLERGPPGPPAAYTTLLFCSPLSRPPDHGVPPDLSSLLHLHPPPRAGTWTWT